MSESCGGWWWDEDVQRVMREQNVTLAQAKDVVRRRIAFEERRASREGSAVHSPATQEKAEGNG